ncbi:metallophosphoesterase [Haloplanus rubicundus]|uniref:Metallophosphoesterase n=1 Tax=Haloplanus rubicundus TaxID=1547898 RepID=A0A345E020_9EURY|nr:metallophosphoesterase family protein [Haloplanus rubicundus]AXG05542.1 metallophosphoesterase [Haloplanus rubicundus]
MRLGVISDVHGNRVALEAVLDDMPKVDRLVCAGDVVGYNPWPTDCVAAVRERSIPTVMGNHDRAVAGETPFRFNSMAAAGVDYAREQLADDALAWLADLPPERTVADGRVKLVHGHPDDPDRYTYPEDFSPRMLRGEDLLVTGHTHVQGHRVFEEGVVMNPGSVGQPRDGDPDAAYAVVELGEGSGGDAVTVEERRVAYDVDTVVEAVTEAGLPSRIGTRLLEGR